MINLRNLAKSLHGLMNTEVADVTDKVAFLEWMRQECVSPHGTDDEMEALLRGWIKHCRKQRQDAALAMLSSK